MPSKRELIRQSILQREKERSEKRKRSGKSHDGHNIRVMNALLPLMRRGVVYSNLELGVELENATDGELKYSSIGPATTYMVREGKIERVERGKYRRIA
jgi:hypothetical protein